MWPLQRHLIHSADAVLHEKPPMKRSAASWDSQARFLPWQLTAFYAAVGKKSSLRVSSSVVSRRDTAIARYLRLPLSPGPETWESTSNRC